MNFTNASFWRKLNYTLKNLSVKFKWQVRDIVIRILRDQTLKERAGWGGMWLVDHWDTKEKVWWWMTQRVVIWFLKYIETKSSRKKFVKKFGQFCVYVLFTTSAGNIISLQLGPDLPRLRSHVWDILFKNLFFIFFFFQI